MYFWSFIGLFLGYLLLASAVVWIFMNLAGRLGAGWKLKLLVVGLTFAVFVAIPTWDIGLAEREFERACQTEAGLKMMKSVEEVPGFMSDFLGGGSVAENFLKRDGYEFYEDRDVLDNMTHYSLNPQGQLMEQKVAKLVARYRLGKIHIFLPYVVKRELFVEDTQTGEKLATQVAIIWRGGWVAQWLLPRQGAYTCEPEQMPIGEFLTKTLKPSRHQRKGAQDANHS